MPSVAKVRVLSPRGLSVCVGSVDHVSTADDVREIALALEGVVEIDSDGFDFRVGNKGFVWSWPQRVPGKPRVIRLDVAVLYVGDVSEQQALVKGEPDLFWIEPGWDGWPFVLVRLPKVTKRRLRELVTDAWDMRRVKDPAAQ